MLKLYFIPFLLLALVGCNVSNSFKDPAPDPNAFQITNFNPGNNSLLVRWSQSLDAISYSVHYREINNTSFITAASGVSTPYIISGLINGASYVVKVKAISSLGKETFSDDITTTIGPGTSAPVTGDFSAPAMTMNAQSFINLVYADVDGDLGTSCTLSSLNNVTVTTPCACNGAGVCTVGVTGNLNYSGPATFRFSVTAGGQISNISTANISIGSVDNPPVANNITPGALTEDLQSIITLSYSDAENNTASTCALSSLTNVTVTQPCACNGTGVCTVGVRGTANYNGAASFNYSVIANGASSGLASANFTINAVDDSPVAANISPAAFAEDTQSIITLSYTDVDGDLAGAGACAISSPSNVSVTQPCACNGFGVCTVGVTGSLNYSGSASFNYTVTTTTLTSNSALATLVINPVNDAPVASNITPPAFNEDIQSIITLSYSDIDLDLASACTISVPSNVSVTQACACNGSGVCTVGVTGTLNYNGPASFNYTVTANTQTSNAATATLSITAADDAPVSSAITPVAFNEDTQSIITLSYTDVESHLATACTISSPTNVTVTQACACAAGACTVGVTGTPNYNGAASFSYTVTANGLTSNLATASLSITGVDDAPVAANISPAAFNEDTQSTITLSYTDTESHAATACTISTPSNVTVTLACACAAGVCTVGVTGTLNYNGAASFNYTVTANTLTSNSATASLSITAVDDAPVAANITPAAFNEDTQSIITLSYTDIESHPATACTISSPTNVTVTQACACAAGTCTVGVTGTLNYNGAASFAYTVTANTLTSNSATATLSITAVADVPVANNFTPANFNEDTQSIITLSYFDGDGDLATACAITSVTNVTVTQACACVTGTCTVGVTGTPNYFGAANFAFTVTANLQTSAPGTASLTITNVDDAPVAASITPANFTAGTQSIITLSYSDIESDLATVCTTSALNNVTVTQACACAAGVCTVGVTGNAAIIDPGSFNYTVTANGALSNTASASFNLICPTGYIKVPGNATLAVSAFCVMRYEARDDGLSVAVSTSTGVPWASISQANAGLECSSLGTKYDLISNPEWMTIARNIENEPMNWSSGIVGSGNLNRGHTDAVPNNAIGITNTADPYDSTGNSSGAGWEQKRTHTLSNSNVIWDFSGNVFEWVDWTLAAGLQTVTPANKAYGNPPDAAPVDAWREFTSLNTNIGALNEMKPETWQASNATFNTTNGIGAYNSGDNTSGGTAHRGGNWNFGTNAGIFNLSLLPSPGVQSIGFRCVYRP